MIEGCSELKCWFSWFSFDRSVGPGQGIYLFDSADGYLHGLKSVEGASVVVRRKRKKERKIRAMLQQTAK